VATQLHTTAARNLRAVCILASLFAIPVLAQAAPGAQNSTSSAAKPAGNTAATAPKPAGKLATRPLWAELTPAQQQALVPLSAEWDKLELFRKKKWLEIAKKYSSMKPQDQLNMQTRMRDWVKLTPEQRRLARENYARAKKLNADQKTAQWQQYQQLPEEQKKKLATDAGSKKQVANLPAAKSKNKTVAPIKSAFKPKPPVAAAVIALPVTSVNQPVTQGPTAPLVPAVPQAPAESARK
jgi:hypothetical protein